MTPTYESPDGRVRLFCADCADILAAMQGAECFVTSPPYNQIGQLPENGSGLWGRTNGGAGFLRAWKDRGYADDIAESDYQQWQVGLFSALKSVASPTASLFYNHQVRWRDGECIHPIDWFKPSGWRLRSEIVWDRGGGMMLNARMFVRFDERILWFVAGNEWKWNQSSVGHGTIWRIAREQQQQGKLHPVAYPIEIPTRCIEAATDADDLVCDPFMGSATTGVAAVNLGRRFVGIEREPSYYAIAERRIREAMGQEVAGKDGTVQRRMFVEADA